MVPPFQFAALFFSYAWESCAVSKYPRGVNWYNDIFETRAHFWPGSARKMTKKRTTTRAHSFGTAPNPQMQRENNSTAGDPEPGNPNMSAKRGGKVPET